VNTPAAAPELSEMVVLFLVALGIGGLLLRARKRRLAA